MLAVSNDDGLSADGHCARLLCRWGVFPLMDTCCGLAGSARMTRTTVAIFKSFSIIESVKCT